MAATPSTMLKLGTNLPPFQLPDVDGNLISSNQFRGAPALLVVFICPHCPFVGHIRSELARFAREYTEKGLRIVAINSIEPEAHAFPQVL